MDFRVLDEDDTDEPSQREERFQESETILLEMSRGWS